MLRKLRSGVLHISTPYGIRCVRLSFRERLAFLWLFRNFPNLPEQVLSEREFQQIESVSERSGVFYRNGEIHVECGDVIGTVERLPSRKAPARETAVVIPMPKQTRGWERGVREIR